MSNHKSTLQSNNTALSSNNLDLQSLIDQANALPDAGGVELPELANEGSAADLLSGKQLIDQEGEVITGTFSIDNELNSQDNLISQIQTALQGKASGGSGGDSINTCTVTLRANGLSIMGYSATAFTESDGVFPLVDIATSGSEFILSNIVCGSVITLRTNQPVIFGYSTTNGAEFVTQNGILCAFFIPQQPSGDIVITVREDD